MSNEMQHDKAQVVLPDGRVGELGQCRSQRCGEEIVWAVSPRTKRPAPYDRDGTSHFATCVDADRFHRKKVQP